MSKSSLAVLLATIPAAQAAWSWNKGTNVCGGVMADCKNAAECSAVGVGDCSKSVTPTRGLQFNVVGMAFVKLATYLDVTTGKTAADAGSGATAKYKVVSTTKDTCINPGDADGDTPDAICADAFNSGLKDKTKQFRCENAVQGDGSKVCEFTKGAQGFRDSNKALTVRDADGGSVDKKVAFAMGGIFVGNDDAGGYIGTTSILNTGTTAVKTRKANVFVATAPKMVPKVGEPNGIFCYGEICSEPVPVDRSKAAATAQSQSKVGAPLGPFEVCITPFVNGNCKDAALRTFAPDTYKYSIFGMIPANSKFDENVIAANGFPEDKVGVRFTMSLLPGTVGCKATDVKVNGKLWEKKTVGEDASTMELCGLKFAFPKKYNVGKHGAAQKDFTFEKSGDIQIRVSDVTDVTAQLTIDYLFKRTDIAEGQYFIYDPDVTNTYDAAAEAAKAKAAADKAAADKAAAAGVPAPAKTDNAASGFTVAAAAVSAVAAVVGLLM